MAIEDPEAIAFCNERVRIQAKVVRKMWAELNDMATAWYAGVNILIPADGGNVVDDRQQYGASQMTGADVHALMGRLADLLAIVNAAGAMDIVHHVCIGPLEAQ